MSFEDISWNRLKSHDAYMKTTEVVAPYRNKGDVKAWPIGQRRYSHRHFTVDKDGIVSIWHGPHKLLSDCRNGFSVEERHKLWMAKACIAKVHPDNSMEFLGDMHQSNSMMMTALTGCYVCQDSRRGGAVIYHKQNEAPYPLFYGFRMRLDNFSVHPDTQYTLRYRRLVRGMSDKVMDKYKQAFDTGLSMMSNMTVDGLHETHGDLERELSELVKIERGKVQQNTSFNYWGTRTRLAKTLLDKDIENNFCVDAVYHAAMTTQYSYWVGNSSTVVMTIAKTKNALKSARKELIRNSPEAFVHVDKGMDEFTTASWGVDVICNGKIASRL